MSERPDHFILVCSTCKGGQSASDVADALTGRLPSEFAIRTVSCMAGCAHPTTVGFQAINKAQYLFGNIQTARDFEALVEFAHQYQQSPDGWTNATDRPRQLYSKTLSRVPRIELEAPE